MVVNGDILLQVLNDDDVLFQHIDKIESIIKEYPYFQPAWAASTRYLKLNNTFIAPHLQQTAARSLDRRVLFEFVNREHTTKQKSDKPEKSQKHLPKQENEQVAEMPDTAIVKEEKNKSNENEKKEPVKIIKPIPRLITNAIPKKLIKPVASKKEGFSERAEQQKETLKKQAPVNEKKEKNIVAKEPEIVVNIELLNKFGVSEKERLKPLEKNNKVDTENDIKLSYTEWLQRFKNNKKQKNIDLIEKFLKDRPKIVPKKNIEVKPPEIIEQSISEKQMLMTETLANLYIKQKKYGKAIQAFRILSLKYPKKSSYFANRINELKQKLK